MNTIATRHRGRGVAWLRGLACCSFSAAVLFLAACVQVIPAADVGNPVAPSGGTSAPTSGPTPVTGALAYTPDLQPIFQSDCVVCHGGSRPSAGYSMTAYAGVMKDVKPGNAQSRLVVWSQPNGSMYRFWTGNAATRANMVKQWVVNYNAQQTR